METDGSSIRDGIPADYSHPNLCQSYIQEPPNGGDDYRVQEWVYRSLPGIGTNVRVGFVDSALDLDYKMIPPPPTDDPKKDAMVRRRFELILETIRHVNDPGPQGGHY